MSTDTRSPVTLLPHENSAVLLERAWLVDARTTCALTRVRPQTPFHRNGGDWPSWIAIELMAQTVAAHATLEKPESGPRPELGLLLGVREFACSIATFETGATLEISAVESLRDENGMGVFDCDLRIEGVGVSRAILSVFLPRSAAAYLGVSGT